MMIRNTVFRIALAAGLAATGVAGCGSMQSGQKADVYEARLSGAQEVPSNSSSGTGVAEVQFNSGTNLLTWKVTYSGLSGPATAGHIHGPAAVGENAGVLIPFTAVGTQPIVGQATITPQQSGDLAAGRWYVNIHTTQAPGGEIRGQLRRRQ